MSINLFRINVWPYGRTNWASLEECAFSVGVAPSTLRRICTTIGAKIIDHRTDDPIRFGGNAHDMRHIEAVDFDKLGASASWRQLMASKESVQEALF